MGAVITRTIDFRCHCGKTESVTLRYKDSNDSYLRELARVRQELINKHGCVSQ